MACGKRRLVVAVAKQRETVSHMTKTYAAIIIGLSLSLVGVAWYYTPYLVAKNAGTWVTEQQGQFGDLFGSVNALFSGLGVVGLTLTLLLQWNELKKTDQAVRESNDLSKASAILASLPQTIRREFKHLQINHSADYKDPDLLTLDAIRKKIKMLEERRIGHNNSLKEKKEALKKLEQEGDTPESLSLRRDVMWLEQNDQSYQKHISMLKKLEAYEVQIEAAQKVMMLNV